MTTDNRNITARDIIAEVIHDMLAGRESEHGYGCNHDTGFGTWTGAPNATECIQAAQDALTKLAEANVHVATDEGATDGHDHVVMFVDRKVRTALRLRLADPDMIGVGYSAFIANALADSQPHRVSGTAAECEAEMRRLTDGERGCANPAEHER